MGSSTGECALIKHATFQSRVCLVAVPTVTESASICVPTSVHKIDIAKGTQKEPWFLRLNPNGRIPVLLDRARKDGFAVFESAAILLYLAQHYDTARRFAFDAQAAPDAHSRMLQWMFFAVSAPTRRGCAPRHAYAPMWLTA